MTAEQNFTYDWAARSFGRKMQSGIDKPRFRILFVVDRPIFIEPMIVYSNLKPLNEQAKYLLEYQDFVRQHEINRILGL